MDATTAHTLPASALLAWWTTSWLRGLVDTDSVLDVMAEAAPVHSVRSLPDSNWNTEGTGLLPLLGLVRSTGARVVGTALPGPGDLVGLAGPAAFNADATEAGEAFVAPTIGLGAVPNQVGAGITWTLHHMHRRPPLDVGEADRSLRTELNRAVDDLVALDVASWSPDTADELLDLAHHRQIVPPPGTPGVAGRLAARAVHLRSITALGLRDAGGSVTAADIAHRTQTLERLDRAARHALVAASSSDAWPEH